MKKILLLILLLFPFKIMAISASSYAVMDYNSGRIITGSNLNTKKLIASTTKIMTCIIALENGQLNNIVKVDENVLKAYGSAIYIEVGEEITLKDLLYGLMLRSGNDAAIEIAINVSGSIPDFVNLMNNKAQDLGMKNTTFVNPSGLEEKDTANYSTSKDMAILMRYCLSNESFVKIIGTKEYKIKTNYKTYLWQNKNRLLKEYKYTIGGKTGFTELARRTLVTAAKKDDKELIVVTLNDPNDFTDHKYLYESLFSKYNLITVLNKNDCHISNTKCYLDRDFKVMLTKEEEKNITVDYELKETNDAIGMVNVNLNNEILASMPIYKEPQKTKNNNKTLWEKIIDTIIFWK